MFGKPYSEYLRFQAPILIAMAVLGLLRLGLSIAGQPDSVVKFVSVTAVSFPRPEFEAVAALLVAEGEVELGRCRETVALLRRELRQRRRDLPRRGGGGQ